MFNPILIIILVVFTEGPTMLRYSQALVVFAAIIASIGCGKSMPSVEGYTRPSDAEARQFAERCAGLVAEGRASEIMDHYDVLFSLHNGPDTRDSSAAEYEEANTQQKGFWLTQLGMLTSATRCNVKLIEEGELGQRVTLESTGKLAGRSVPILVCLDLVKKPDGQIAIFTLFIDTPNR